MQVFNDSGALGMAYDSAGHLFVVTAPNQVAQMDPNTGAILNGVTSPSRAALGPTAWHSIHSPESST